MQTVEALIERVKKPSSFLGFDADALYTFVPMPEVLELLTDEGKARYESGEAKPTPLTRENVIEAMREYMERIGWEKVEDHRGISAGRTVEKMEAWIWLLDDRDTLKAVEDAPYENYGAPKLAVVCKAYGFPIPEDQDIQRMIRGERCSAGCTGCGH